MVCRVATQCMCVCVSFNSVYFPLICFCVSLFYFLLFGVCCIFTRRPFCWRVFYIDLKVLSYLNWCWIFSTGIAAQNISYYEAIDYNITNVLKQHLEAVNFPKSSVVTINFSAFQRYVLIKHNNIPSLRLYIVFHLVTII